MPTETARFRELLASFCGKRILVAGDLMLDEFVWGKVSRISPEAPVPIVQVTGESYYPGGAANVARNVREFTDCVAVMGTAGSDAPGRRLLELLQESGVETCGVHQDAVFSTTVKTRIIARNQQVVRVDREHTAPLTDLHAARAMEYLDREIPAVDAIIVTDYGKGFVTQDLADHISRVASGSGKILVVDPHPYTSLSWRGATAVKPNRTEAFLEAGMRVSDVTPPILSDQGLLEAARRLLELWEPQSLLITLGEHGMLLVQPDVPPHHISARGRDIFDVSGAGDTAIAVFTLGLAAGATPMEAAELANCASGIAVGKLGTATVTTAELGAAVAGL